MHSAWRTEKTWAFCAVLAISMLVSAKPVLAQKFARGSRPSRPEAVADEDDGPELSSPAPKAAERRPVKFRSPKTLSHSQVAARPANPRATIPDWQRNPGPRFQQTAKRRLQPTPAQEYDLPLNRAMTNPAMRDGNEIIVDDGTVVDEGEVIGPGFVDGQVIGPGEDGDVIYEGGDFDPWGAGMQGSGMLGDCASCGSHVCGPDCDDPCPYARPCDGICIPRHRIEETSLFLGPQGFKGPLDFGRNGNFGTHEGVNFAGQFGRWLGLAWLDIGYQVGATFVQSDFSGNSVFGSQSKERDQQFITSGLYRRAFHGQGFQFGAVYDYLHDNYYFKYNVGQVRAELSYLTCCGHEIGFWGAFHARRGQAFLPGAATPSTLQTIDMYNLFYRYNFRDGSQSRIWAGGTGNKGGVLGADFRVVLANRWDLMGAVNYLIPAQGGGTLGAAHEAWGMGMNLVWYPGRRPRGNHNSPYRALFTPADNSTLITQIPGM